MSTHRTGSYEYNTICDVCGFKFKASELKQRWDGPMVCKEDWEPRNILDFYRTRNDVHKLPFVRSDNQVEHTWTPVFVNLTAVGTNTKTGTYREDDANSTIDFQIQILPDALSTTSTSSATVTLPVTSVSAGTVRAFDSAGKYLGAGTIGVAATTATLPNWIVNRNNITISGTYGV
jgi:hypothetical protein